MSYINKQNCKQCNEYYEGRGKYFCSNSCRMFSNLNPSFSNGGEKHYNWKGGKSKCKDCGKETSDRKCIRCKLCSDKFYVGKNTSNWRGGISLQKYPFEFSKKLRELIRKRDNYTCQVCGITQKQELKRFNKKLSIHHMNYNKKDCKPSNLITTCILCNNNANYLRGFWITWFYTTFNTKKWGLAL